MGLGMIIVHSTVRHPQRGGIWAAERPVIGAAIECSAIFLSIAILADTYLVQERQNFSSYIPSGCCVIGHCMPTTPGRIFEAFADHVSVGHHFSRHSRYPFLPPS